MGNKSLTNNFFDNSDQEDTTNRSRQRSTSPISSQRDNIIKRNEFSKAPNKSILIYSRTEIRLQHEIDAKISNQQRNLIFGYIHAIEKQFNDTNSNDKNLLIPIPIIYIFAAFYCVFRDEWNKHFCGSDFIFIGHKIIKKINLNRWSLCAFGYEVNDKICDILTIEFTWKSEIEINSNGLCIGYIKTDKLDTIKWDGYRLGDSANNKNSFCVDMELNESYFDDSTSDDDIIMGHDDTFSVKSCTLSFNFIDQTLIVYTNKKKNTEIKFECKSIIPAIAIYNKGELVEVSKYELTRSESIR